MPKIRNMSAGRAGSSLYNSNVNGNQGGGNKKGGLASTTNKRVQFVIPALRTRAYSSPDQRKMIFCVNQLGGVGAPSKMFATTADGSCASCSKEAKAHNFVVFAYRQLLGRGADQNGLRKYTKQILNDPRGLAVGMSQVVFDLTNSPEGKKFARKIGSVETQKRIAAANDFITSSTVVPDNFTPIGEEAVLTECDQIDSSPNESLIWKKVTKMLRGCDVDGSLSVDDLENYIKEGFTKSLENQKGKMPNWVEAGYYTEEEAAQAISEWEREVDIYKSYAREFAKTMITYYDTSGNGVISVTEISNHPESHLMNSQRGDERQKCHEDLNNDFFNIIENYNTTEVDGWITQSDWATYINSSDKHPAFKLEHWDADNAFPDLNFEEFDGVQMMEVRSLHRVVIPIWKLTRPTDGSDPLTDTQFIDLLNNDDGVETIEFDIGTEESFMIDTNGTGLSRSPGWGYSFNHGIDSYLKLYNANGVLVRSSDDDGGGHDARIILKSDEIIYDDENKAVYYALAIPLDLSSEFEFRTNDGLAEIDGDQKISQFQNITYEALCHYSSSYLTEGYKLHVNTTIITNPSLTLADAPKDDVEDDDSTRVSYGDLKLWYQGNSVSSADGTTNYDPPRLYSSKIYDLRNENCHKWVKITLNKIV